jgi:hypothetical protein
MGCILAITVLTAAPDLPQAPVRKIKPVMVWTGNDSAIATREFVLCRSEDELEKLWSRHRPNKDPLRHGLESGDAPQLEFDSYMLLAILDGKGKQNTGINVVEVTEDDHQVRVRYRMRTFQAPGVPGLAKTPIPQSYAFIPLPKSAKLIVLQQDAGNLTGPRVWEERARICPGQ